MDFYQISLLNPAATFPFLERLSTNTNLQVIGICQDEPVGAVESNKCFAFTFQSCSKQLRDAIVSDDLRSNQTNTTNWVRKNPLYPSELVAIKEQRI